jgi:hypothetical protein
MITTLKKTKLSIQSKSMEELINTINIKLFLFLCSVRVMCVFKLFDNK